jgi:FkbH-like protein
VSGLNEAHASCLLIADFTIDTLGGYLENEGEPRVGATVAPFGPVIPVLARADAPCWRERPDFALVWTRPAAAIESFERLARFEEVPPEALDEEVDAFAALLVEASKRVRALFVASWALAPRERGLGLLDLRPGSGLAHALLRMNLRLAERVAEADNVYLLDTQRWMSASPAHGVNPKLWYTAKVAFANQVLKEAAADVRAAVRGLTGGARKLVVLDLDDTLWGGIVGDLGWENLRLGGHDPLGEAFVEFQRELERLTRRGVLLAIASKNDEQIALEAIDKHPEMVLRREHFAGWRIDWQDKAHNVAELVNELNLGLQSAVFIDDSPVERARVREALPEVLVPEWPGDRMLYASALHELRCFDGATLSAEDRGRSTEYARERARRALRATARSAEDWLARLEVVIGVEPLSPANLPRTAQLLNKTNQMNLSTRRLTEGELADWAAAEGRELWTVRVADRFGEAGLTGIASLAVDGGVARVVDLVLSCRVFSRGIEDAMLHVLSERARALGARRLEAEYLATAKNRPCLEFLERSCLEREGERRFVWDLARPCPAPGHVRIEGDVSR